MSRYIDADALLEFCDNAKSKTIDYNDIARFPSIDIDKVQEGRMIKAEWTNKDSLDLQPTCNQLATDLISRQSAIDAVEKAVFKDVAKSAIESLPSVEPPKYVTVTFDDEKLREIVDDLIINQGLEQVVHCKDCRWYVRSDGKWQYWVCKIFEKIMRENDYCIYGEQADEDKNE